MATPRSLKLSPDGKRQVDRVLTDKQWSTEDLAAAISVGRATATTFRAGKKGVDRNNFVEFCRKLGLDWEAVAESESPPAPNSRGAEPVEKARSTTAENLYSRAESVQFLINVGEQSQVHWCLDNNRFFQIDNNGRELRYRYYPQLDPSFDITLISDFTSVKVVHKFGIEIVNIQRSFANLIHLPLAAEVTQQAHYKIEMPDIRSKIRRDYSLLPREINSLLVARTNKKFILDSHRKILNYEVLLKKYVKNMPNEACIRFWIKTQDNQYFSDLIRISTQHY
jgi:DNA-binding Xre family transcriptional regulator